MTSTMIRSPSCNSLDSLGSCALSFADDLSLDSKGSVDLALELLQEQPKTSLPVIIDIAKVEENGNGNDLGNFEDDDVSVEIVEPPTQHFLLLEDMSIDPADLQNELRCEEPSASWDDLFTDHEEQRMLQRIDDQSEWSDYSDLMQSDIIEISTEAVVEECLLDDQRFNEYVAAQMAARQRAAALPLSIDRILLVLRLKNDSRAYEAEGIVHRCCAEHAQQQTKKGRKRSRKHDNLSGTILEELLKQFGSSFSDVIHYSMAMTADQVLEARKEVRARQHFILPCEIPAGYTPVMVPYHPRQATTVVSHQQLQMAVAYGVHVASQTEGESRSRSELVHNGISSFGRMSEEERRGFYLSFVRK